MEALCLSLSQSINDQCSTQQTKFPKSSSHARDQSNRRDRLHTCTLMKTEFLLLWQQHFMYPLATRKHRLHLSFEVNQLPVSEHNLKYHPTTPELWVDVWTHSLAFINVHFLVLAFLLSIYSYLCLLVPHICMFE